MNYANQLTSSVGPAEYLRLAESVKYYERHGFRYIDTPWLVQQKVNYTTKPRWAAPMHHYVKALDHTFHFVASGEQSFLQLQYEAMKSGGKLQGKYQTITPCYRDEDRIDSLRRIGFMKLELIDFSEITDLNLQYIVSVAMGNLGGYLPVMAMTNDQHTEHGIDIVDVRNHIELGSYGIREATIGGKTFQWIYGTGLAEPRLREVLKLQ